MHKPNFYYPHFTPKQTFTTIQQGILYIEVSLHCSINKDNNSYTYLLPLKEIVERRHGEPIKFLSLPKMDLMGSQAGNEKIAGCEL